MAYQTGQVSSAAGLLSALQTFAQANGWTLAGDVLSAGNAYISITSPSALEVRITGLRDGLVASPDACPRLSRIAFSAAWPAAATYHFFAQSNPRTIWATMVVNVVEHFHLGFGEMQKYGTWSGGQWFHAQHGANGQDNACFSKIDGGGQPYYGAIGEPRECGLFWDQRDGCQWDSDPIVNKCSYLHCELRGYVWESTFSASDDTDLNIIHVPSIITPVHKRNPNAFNGQTVLTPFDLYLQNTDGHYMPIGHIGHIRFVKLTNYNPGDILEIGSDRWMVFPWHIKDSDNPDGLSPGYGNTGRTSTGVQGCAVFYDGP